MSVITDYLTMSETEIVRHRTNSRAELIVFTATPEVMKRLSIGNAEAWQRIIEDNDPHDDGRLYVRLEIRNTGNGAVNVLTPEQVAATASWEQTS